MSAINSVRDLFARWREVPAQPGREAFYRILHSVDLETLKPSMNMGDTDVPNTPEAYQLVRLWEAWIAFVDGNSRWGWTILNEISRSLFFLPEPHLLVGAAALIEGDSRAAVRAFRRGVRVDASYQVFYDLLDQFGQREKPVLPFLRRNHPLNNVLGKLRSEVRKRTGAHRSPQSEGRSE